jgi:SAM-dependent methyltransferase
VDRQTFLRERRRMSEERFDTRHAPSYDAGYGEISPTHHRFVADVIRRCPPGGRILDAACGTGKYFAMILEAGCQVLGTDQSAGMLARAHARHPEILTYKVGLQELAYTGEFDAALCVDAMENVCPEDWPGVLANLRRALRPAGSLYLTVELSDEHDLARTFAEGVADGLPVVPGEHTSRDGGYHYYPSVDQVASWLAGVGLELVHDGYGDDYYHLLARAGGDR